jgi:hypothetical protein
MSQLRSSWEVQAPLMRYSFSAYLLVKRPLKSSMGKIWQFPFVLQVRLRWWPFYWSTLAREEPLRDTSKSRFNRIWTLSTSKFMETFHILIISWTVPWLTRLVAGFTPRRSWFGSMLIQVGFLVENVELGQAFVRVLRFLVSVVPSTIRTHSFTCYRCSLILVTDSVVK